MAQYLFVVFTEPVPGQDDVYNDWYSHQHLADVVRMPGYVSAQRFEFVPLEGTTSPSRRYLALYTVETNDLAATHKALLGAAGSAALPISDSLDPTKIAMGYFKPLGRAQRAQGCSLDTDTNITL